ncbi:uncharacterized protein LOC132945685 [Metopolophium dirhodum]|uniref:uncharacterized protein LOC132945685 n=1 Tax=Metopolophium dirhodum TaxID=44670 RepID=UPI00298F5FD9|nr:uncharacterized protein LOC132945685 [Metopolophium dirhodum]
MTYQLEYLTREQNHSQKWFSERKKRLTASKFGDVCRMRINTSCKVKVHNMLYKSSITSKEMTHGVENESLARTRFQDLTGMTVKLCGLFTDNEYPYLAASPDGLIGDNAIVEIKCPYTARDTNNAKEAIESKLLQYCIINKDGTIKLKKEHPYFYQIIGQLRITGRNICFFVVHTNNWTHIEKIIYDCQFWETEMVNKLKKFYLECILPEIVDPLYGRRLQIADIREPLHILKAQEEKNKTKHEHVPDITQMLMNIGHILKMAQVLRRNGKSFDSKRTTYQKLKIFMDNRVAEHLNDNGKRGIKIAM